MSKLLDHLYITGTIFCSRLILANLQHLKFNSEAEPGPIICWICTIISLNCNILQFWQEDWNNQCTAFHRGKPLLILSFSLSLISGVSPWLNTEVLAAALVFFQKFFRNSWHFSCLFTWAGRILVWSSCELNKFTGLVYNAAWERVLSATLRVLWDCGGMRGRKKQELFCPILLPRPSCSKTLASW